MTSGTAPCWGWVLPATRDVFAKLDVRLSDDDAEALIECLGLVGLSEEGLNAELREDEELFQSVIGELEDNSQLTVTLRDKDQTFDVEVGFFHYNADDGDAYDQLENGLCYLSFGRDDVLSPTPFAQALQKQDLMPEEKGWTNYG